MGGGGGRYTIETGGGGGRGEENQSEIKYKNMKILKRGRKKGIITKGKTSK